MNHNDQIKAVEDRAFSVRLNMGDLCKIAGVSPSTWSRARSRGTIRVRTLRKIEEALDQYERWKADDEARREGRVNG